MSSQPPPRPPQLALDVGERKRFERIQRLAWLLDNAIPIPFTRFRIGLDPLIGLVPGLGDALGAGISGWIILEAARFGVSKSVLLRMLLNVAIDTGIGAIPGAGDLFDFAWKSDQMNLNLLHRHLESPEGARRASRLFLILLTLAMLLVIVGVTVGAVFLVKSLIGLLPHGA
ncbi:MAG TPA: DUF4112 domain-containing protein [Gemmatimonadales bacterium]|nr:DUF4112 domain-containing protein [Gemmatimonadales bacterium]